MVIGAAVLLFIASFLDTFGCSGSNCGNVPTAWDNGSLLLGVYLAGIIGAALVVISRALPQPPKVIGLDLGQLGVALTVFTAWSALGAIFDPAGSLDIGSSSVDAGTGLILGFIAALVLAAGAICSLIVPVFKAPLIGAPRPAGPLPSGMLPHPPAATATRAPSSSPTTYSRVILSRVSPSRTSPSRSRVISSRPRPGRSRPAAPPTSRRSGSRFRWPARCTARTVHRLRSPNSRRAPGTSRSSSAVLASSPRRRTAAVASCRTPRASSAADASG